MSWWPRSLSVQSSRSVMSDSLKPRGLQHARLPCPSPSPRAFSNCMLEEFNVQQSMGLQRFGHDRRLTHTHTHTQTHHTRMHTRTHTHTHAHTQPHHARTHRHTHHTHTRTHTLQRLGTGAWRQLPFCQRACRAWPGAPGVETSPSRAGAAGSIPAGGRPVWCLSALMIIYWSGN